MGYLSGLGDALGLEQKLFSTKLTFVMMTGIPLARARSTVENASALPSTMMYTNDIGTSSPKTNQLDNAMHNRRVSERFNE